MAVRIRVGSPQRIGVAIAALGVAAALIYGSIAYSEGYAPFAPPEDRWTGVFLTNGQAYFGHFYSGPGECAWLREVYYVLATQLQSQQPETAPQTQLSVQPLGGEIYGPKQEMCIWKEQILFTEELRADSRVVQTIRQIKSGIAPVPSPTSSP